MSFSKKTKPNSQPNEFWFSKTNFIVLNMIAFILIATLALGLFILYKNQAPIKIKTSALEIKN